MALANYTDLQASIASWMVRTDLAAVIPDFVAIAEARINADVRLRQGISSGSLSTAEAIAVTIGAWAEAGHFGSGVIDASSLAANLVGAIVKDPVQDKIVLQEYLEVVVRERKDWGDLYSAIREVI